MRWTWIIVLHDVIGRVIDLILSRPRQLDIKANVSLSDQTYQCQIWMICCPIDEPKFGQSARVGEIITERSQMTPISEPSVQATSTKIATGEPWASAFEDLHAAA